MYSHVPRDSSAEPGSSTHTQDQSRGGLPCHQDSYLTDQDIVGLDVALHNTHTVNANKRFENLVNSIHQHALADAILREGTWDDSLHTTEQ